MPRSRRAFLAAVGASATLAGCTVRAPTQEARYRVSARVAEPAEDPVGYSVEVTRPVATKWQPMLVGSTYENTGDEAVTITVSLGRAQTVFSRETTPGIALIDPTVDYEQAEPGCWMPEADSFIVLLGIPQYDLQPGERVSVEHAVWGNPPSPDQDNCLDPGTYRVPMEQRAEIDVTVETA